MSLDRTVSPVAIAHISTQTTLAPAIRGWRIYLEDQGLSPHTIKAFTGDLSLIASYLPPDRTLGGISTNVDFASSHFSQFSQLPCINVH